MYGKHPELIFNNPQRGLCRYTHTIITSKAKGISLFKPCKEKARCFKPSN